MADVLRYAAFTLGGEGGNPAGVVLDAEDLDDTVRGAGGFGSTGLLP